MKCIYYQGYIRTYSYTEQGLSETYLASVRVSSDLTSQNLRYLVDPAANLSRYLSELLFTALENRRHFEEYGTIIFTTWNCACADSFVLVVR